MTEIQTINRLIGVALSSDNRPAKDFTLQITFGRFTGNDCFFEFRLPTWFGSESACAGFRLTFPPDSDFSSPMGQQIIYDIAYADLLSDDQRAAIDRMLRALYEAISSRGRNRLMPLHLSRRAPTSRAVAKHAPAHFYIVMPSGEEGPFTLTQLRRLCAEGDVTPDLPIRREGMASSVPLRQELLTELKKPFLGDG